MSKQLHVNTGAKLILAERNRQVFVEGYKPENDLEYGQDEIPQAAIVYIASSAKYELASEVPWPWDAGYFKPTTPIRNLVKAGALIAAEIDRRLNKGEKP